MYKEELKIAKVTLALVSQMLEILMRSSKVDPEELPLYGKVVSKAQSDVKYYEELVEKYKTEE